MTATSFVGDLGLDHLKLTFKFQGRPFRLTDAAGDVIHTLIA
jgi:hypothetical protein